MMTPMRWLRKMLGMADAYIIRRRRSYAAAAQHGLCYWCDTPLGLDVTAEHLVPLSKGGHRRRRSNIAAAHSSCNRARGNRDRPSEAYLRQRRVGYLRMNGVETGARWRGWRKEQENFGQDPEGKKLWAPQYGIM